MNAVLVYMIIGLTVYATERAPTTREIASDTHILGVWRAVLTEVAHFTAVVAIWPVYVWSSRVVGGRRIAGLAYVLILAGSTGLLWLGGAL